MSDHASDDPVKVFCGKAEGMLDPTRFGPGVKSRCIEHRGNWLTPPEFELLGGKSKHYRWRRNIKTETGTRFGQLMENGFLKHCSKNCSCDICEDGGIVSSVTKNPHDELSAKVKHESSFNVSKDTDSDSGISMISSTNNVNQMALLKTVSPSVPVLPSSEIRSGKKKLDYLSMVQEAIFSLSRGQTDCTNLNILLYILNRHTPTDDISIIHTKVRTALSFLTRMGFLERTGNDEDSDDNESADFVMTSQKSPTKSKKDEEVKSTTDAPSKTTTSKTVVKVKAKNFVVKKANKVKAKVKNTNKKVKKVVDENVQKRNIAFQRKRLSPALAAICGKRILSRQDVIKRLWRYIKKRKLQDPDVKTKIHCDDKLKAVAKKTYIDQKEMFALMKLNLTDV